MLEIDCPLIWMVSIFPARWRHLSFCFAVSCWLSSINLFVSLTKPAKNDLLTALIFSGVLKGVTLVGSPVDVSALISSIGLSNSSIWFWVTVSSVTSWSGVTSPALILLSTSLVSGALFLFAELLKISTITFSV